MLPVEGPTHFRKNLILLSIEAGFVLLNKFPYNNGHLMVVPHRHVASPLSLSSEEYRSFSQLLWQSLSALEQALHPDGVNIGMNLGRAAGAGIDQHCHWHLVPRWDGDTNFMPVIAETKVISQHLYTTYDQLVGCFPLISEGVIDR